MTIPNPVTKPGEPFRVRLHSVALTRSLVVGAYLVRHEGMTGDQAVETIRQQRSPACLCNADFEAYVRGLS